MNKLTGVAAALWDAEKSRQPIAPLTETYPGFGEAEAYNVQDLVAAHHMNLGAKHVGYKIGLTSKEAQKHFNVFEPDYGHLFDSMIVDDDATIKMSDLIQAKIEGEIAFVLGKDLGGPGVTIAEAMRAVDFVTASLEIVDSRIKDWKIRAADTIADNGSSSRFVLSGKKTRLDEVDLPYCGMALWKNGEVELTAAGSAVMGNPLHAVVFLANLLGHHGKKLEAGQVILSGSLGGMVKVAAGDWYRCEILRLGKCGVRFHA